MGTAAIIGEIRRGKEIGGKNPRKWYQKFIWAACGKCGKERWVEIRRGVPISRICKDCKTGAGESCPHWKGGIKKDKAGYVFKWIPSDNPFASMRNVSGYVFEHRLIVAQHLGRCLLGEEIVHHLNGIKDDNRIGNLALVSQNNHPRTMFTHLYIRKLQERIRELENDNGHK